MSLFKFVGQHRMALGFCPSADCSQVYRKPRPQDPDPTPPGLKRPTSTNARVIARYEKELKTLWKAAEKAAKAKGEQLRAQAAKETQPFAEAGGLFHCDMCGVEYCTACLTVEGLPVKWHEGVTCDEFRARRAMAASGYKAQEAFMKWRAEQGANVKPCPDCGILCEKVSGCNRVTCGGCKNSFCWKCGTFSAKTHSKVYAHLKKEHGGYH